MEHHRMTGHEFLRTGALPLERDEARERRRNLVGWLKNHLLVVLGRWRIMNREVMPSGAHDVLSHRGVDHQEKPLTDLKPGQCGIVARVDTTDSHHLQKLMAMGVMPEENIRLLRRFPSFIFEVNYSQFAVDREIASRIFVRLAHD